MQTTQLDGNNQSFCETTAFHGLNNCFLVTCDGTLSLLTDAHFTFVGSIVCGLIHVAE